MKKILFFGVCIFLLNACNLKPPPPSILEGLVCDLPCWENIIPGETTEDEFYRIIGNLEDIDEDSILKLREPWNGFGDRVRFKLISNDYITSIAVFMIEDIVVLISIEHNLGINIGNMINVLDEPNGIFVLFFDNYFPIFFYQDIGIAFMYDEDDLPRSSRGDITSEIEVTEIDLFDPSIFPMMYERGILTTFPFTEGEFLSKLYPWVGYGNINDNYR